MSSGTLNRAQLNSTQPWYAQHSYQLYHVIWRAPVTVPCISLSANQSIKYVYGTWCQSSRTLDRLVFADSLSRKRKQPRRSLPTWITFSENYLRSAYRCYCTVLRRVWWNKKVQLSLTNPRDAKACQKLLQFDVLTTLSLTTVAYLHAFSCCCVRNLRNPEKFTENSNLWSSRSSKVIDLVPIESPYVTCY